jgi:tetratricopeptide (TPR) repeat protein
MTESSDKPPIVDEISVLEADALVQAGLAASQAGEPDKALHLFARASAINPSSALPLFLIGSEYAAMGEVDKAETALANAVVLAPQLHIARYQLGLLQFSSGRPAPALVSWGPLFELDDSRALLHFVRGFAALAHDDFAAAEKHFEAGLLRNHENGALTGDIQKVLQGVRQARSADPAAPAAEDGDAASHVLVSNYGKFGTLH